MDQHTVRIPKELMSFIRMITTPPLASVSKCLLGLNLIQMSVGWFVRGRDRSPEHREEVGRCLCCGCQGGGQGPGTGRGQDRIRDELLGVGLEQEEHESGQGSEGA